MNINATIIIQAINFFIAYLLFRFILLKKAYAAIKEDDRAKASLEQLVADDKRLVEQRRQETLDQWHASYSFFKAHVPKPTDKIALLRGVVPKIKPKPIDDAAMKEMEDRVAQAIVTAIGVLDDRR